MANVTEHRLEMPVAGATGKAASARPEKRLNHFVHFVAMMERFGNALGTLAFTWATVVLLGGYSDKLTTDFYTATVIIFIEAVRMFSRDNRMDYQMFFRTRGAFRSLGCNALIQLLCFVNVLLRIAIICDGDEKAYKLTISMMILLIGTILYPEAAIPTICNPLRRTISFWRSLVAILMLFLSVLYRGVDEDPNQKDPIIPRIVYLVLFVVTLMLTISRLRFPTIMKLADSPLGRKIVYWRPVIMNLCMFAALVMSVFTFPEGTMLVFITLDIYALMIASFGNLQIPVAVLRIGMALWGLHVIPPSFFDAFKQVEDHSGNKKQVDKPLGNLKSSLIIFYRMVLGQGILYIAAGILEIFSFILRRSLIGRAGFRGQGVQYVNLYYAYVFNKCMQGAVLVRENTSIIAFAMDYLMLGSPKMQLYGLKMLHNFLKKEPLKTKAKSELTTSMKTITCLVNMLGWTSARDKDIRSFAAKVTAEVADNLRVVHVPGAMQLIASLLDTPHVWKVKDPLLDIGSPQPEQDNLIQQQQVSENEPTFPKLKWLKQMVVYCLIPGEEPSNMDEQTPRILRCFWKWSVPEEEPSTDVDLLPNLGMLILEKLARFDLENCKEIYRATGLISRIIEFTTNRTYMTNISEIQQAMLKGSALKLLISLSGTEGKLGVTLRQKISENPFIFSHLAEILDPNGSSLQELRELTTELLRNLAMDGNTEEMIHIRVVIRRLVHAFLSQSASSSTDSDQLLPMMAGQALALLAIESANTCLVMIEEPRYAFIKKITVMIQGDRYKYIASSLLRNMCIHARAEFDNSDLKEVSNILRKVLVGIVDAEGTELEMLVGLSSQICKVIPEDFVRELKHDHQIKDKFIKKLVHALKANMIPAAHCPGIRRVIVEHVISMIECNPSCANCFNKYRMMEALLMVERSPARVENYRFYLGDTGLMEHSKPMSDVVSRAKELMSRELWGISSVI